MRPQGWSRVHTRRAKPGVINNIWTSVAVTSGATQICLEKRDWNGECKQVDFITGPNAILRGRAVELSFHYPKALESVHTVHVSSAQSEEVDALSKTETSLKEALVIFFMAFCWSLLPTYTIWRQICQFILRFAYVSGSARLHQLTWKARDFDVWSLPRPFNIKATNMSVFSHHRPSQLTFHPSLLPSPLVQCQEVTVRASSSSVVAHLAVQSLASSPPRSIQTRHLSPS